MPDSRCWQAQKPEKHLNNGHFSFMRPPGLLHLNITLKHFGRSLFGHQVQMVAKSNECQ